MERRNVISEDVFQNEATRRLFNAIDELKSCGASRDIENLPEIIVVGDQSVGKSSLLQSLTEIPFAVAGKLCTRFPIRIVSRRSAKEQIDVSIEPQLFSVFSPFSISHIIEADEQRDARRVRQAGYKGFERSFSTFTAQDFAFVIEKASQFMQIVEVSPSTADAAPRPLYNFSEDTLKIEIQGPNRSHFAILDLPGNFHSLTGGLVENDMKLVRNLVLQRMSYEQSIIVCVASGPTDLANQGVFDMATEKDPKGTRTIGVITKCDVTQDPTEIVEIVKNGSRHMNHEWFVVRNRTPSEVKNGISTQEHHQKELEFFRNKPWSSIPEERRGTMELKSYLSDKLCARYQSVFPQIRRDVQMKRSETEKALSIMGPTRETLVKKRAYLSDIALAFHSLILQSLLGEYGSLTVDTMKLRMKVREANDTFADTIKQSGHAVPFSDTSQPESTRATQPSGPAPLGYFLGHEISKSNAFGTKVKSSGGVQDSSSSSGSNATFTSASEPSLSTVADSTALPSFGTFPRATPAQSQARNIHPLPKSNKQSSQSLFEKSFVQRAEQTPLFGSETRNGQLSFAFGSKDGQDKANIYHWIRHEINASRGTELQGTLNPSVMPILFHRQAQNWRDLAEAHFMNIKKSTDMAVTQILEMVCKDGFARRKIQIWVKDSSRKQEESCSKNLTEHLNNVLSKHLQTNNDAFESKVKEARMRRFETALRRYGRSSPFRSKVGHDAADGLLDGNEDKIVVDLHDTAALFAEIHMSNQQNLEDEIHDILKAYYEIARDNFVEFINVHIIERYLDNQEGPVFAFLPAYIGKMTDAEVEYMAAENDDMVRRRADLKASLERLLKAEEIIDRCADGQINVPQSPIE